MKQKIKLFFGKLYDWFTKKRTVIKVLLVLIIIWLFQMVFCFSYIILGCGDGEKFTQVSSAQISESWKSEYKLRSEESTYLTFPEWYIVYSTEESAELDKNNRPSSFPYFSATRQFWKSYCEVTRVTKANYNFNLGNHIMIFVIGESFTIENTFKGIYENTIGRIFELFGNSKEDDFAQSVNEDYANFLYTSPWYEYPFHKKFIGLWTDTGVFGQGTLRKFERKIVLSAEYLIKSAYGWIIKAGTKSLYGNADLEIYAITVDLPPGLTERESNVKILKQEDEKSLVVLPRYEEFTRIVAKEKLRFYEIAGNDEILVSVIAPRSLAEQPTKTIKLYSMDILTKPDLTRWLLKVNVADLNTVLSDFEKDKIKLEHIYDY